MKPERFPRAVFLFVREPDLNAVRQSFLRKGAIQEYSGNAFSACVLLKSRKGLPLLFISNVWISPLGQPSIGIVAKGAKSLAPAN